MGRVAFIPWTKFQNADEFAGYVRKWNSANTHSGHQWTIVMWKDKTAAATMGNLGFGSTIRIVGHGEAGSHKISCDEAGSNGLSYEAVFDRLVTSGLKRSFAGTIDCHSCSSGVPRPGSQSFAAKLANHLRLNGYLLISVVGYFGDLNADYHDNGGKYHHKYVTMFGGEVKKKWARMRF